MYISVPNQSLAPNESVAAKAKKPSTKKDPIVSIGAALMWPAFAAGSLIFSADKNSEPANVEPYRSEIK